MYEPEIYTVDIDAVLRQYSDTVYKIALSQVKNKNDADDVFQEVFLRLVKNSKPISSSEHMKAWLIRVTINCCKKHFKRWSSKTAELLEDIPYVTPEEHDIYYAVLELPPKYRSVIHLFYYEDLSIKQISDILNLKETTVKSQLSRGRDKLKEKLKGEFGDYVKSI